MSKCVAIDLTGKIFGRITVIKRAPKDKRGECYWLCRCSCGNIKRVSGYKLRSGNTRSCGCLQNEIRKSGTLRRTHGMTNTRLYAIWSNMKSRCENPKNIEYAAYGGRGISVCKEWHKFEAFYHWAISSGYRDNLTIDRINVNNGYLPGNCRWASSAEQSLNRTDNHFITAFGKKQTIKEWSLESGLKYDTIERRINQYGYTPEEAVSLPLWSKRRN